MTGARSDILAGIRHSLGRGVLGGEGEAKVEARLRDPARNLVPARAKVPQYERIAMFLDYLGRVDGTSVRVAKPEDVPEALTRYLATENLPPRVVMAPDTRLAAIPWPAQRLLDVRHGEAALDEPVGVTGAFAAIAETGTLLLTSGAHHPSRLNLLPDTHVVVLWASQIVGVMEDAWDALRANGAVMPRTALFVTGPSRTADIEVTLYLGAHGPRRLHVILVDDVVRSAASTEGSPK